jgi:aldose 1-epimerase
LSTFVRLRNADLTAEIAPETGGALSAFYSQDNGKRTHWLRPASGQTLANSDVLGMSCFPLVPFSNRIRDGRFDFHGQTIQLPLNFGDHPHAIHGFGWQNVWTVEAQTDDQVSLVNVHAADAWPWAWQARQDFSLQGSALEVTLSLTNESDQDMPAGLGLHPYFPRSSGAVITAGVEAMWQVDDEVMPVSLNAPLPSADPNTGLNVADSILDNGFTGWRGRAEINWPDRTRSLVMTATEPLDQLVIFTPAEEDFFCVEPVSHGTDAVNASGPDDRGLIILAPGQTVSASVTFEVVG